LKNKDDTFTQKGAEKIWRIKQLWIQFPRKPLVDLDNTYETQTKSSTSVRKQDLGPFHEIIQKHHEDQRPQSQDQFDNYCAETPSYEISLSPIQWWAQDVQQRRWPRLSRFALDILSIPAMSDKPERIFSGARRTISWEKAQLNPDTVELRELLKDWKRSEILKDQLSDPE
jgi:hypothetical protein